MKVALVHDVLNQLGGAEKVLENFLDIWPDATIHTVFYDEKKTEGKFARFNKKISWLNKLPLAHNHPRLFVTMFPFAFEQFKFDDFDVVISDSSAFAKGVKTNKLHICYCHTPTRFLWTEHSYLKNQKYPNFMRSIGSWFIPWLRKWDFKAAQRSNYMIANSVNVQNRIKKYYNRDSAVVPPPVDTDFFKPTADKKDYFLIVTRLEPYKKVDVIIEAFNKLGLPLKIVGTGTIADDLKKIAQPNIEFLGRISDDELRKVYSEAKAFIFAAEEDAGIVFLEAQAAGTPVIAFRKGGALEAVQEGVTGEFFNEQTSDSIINAIKHFNTVVYDSEKIRQHALQFDKKIFQKKIKEFVEEKYANRT